MRLNPYDRASAVVDSMGEDIGPDNVIWPETWRRRIEHAILDGYDAATRALRDATFEPMPKPTIEELEKILNSPAPAVHINPDGSIGVCPSQFATAVEYLESHRPKSR
jgi:hypothetical protein